MHSIDLIRDNLKLSAEIVLSRVEEMQEHCFVFPTTKGGCHTLWTLGHLAFIESRVINCFMLGDANPLDDWEEMFDGNDISESADDFPPFHRVLEECRNRRRATISLLGSMAEHDLDKISKNAPVGARELFGNYRCCFSYAANHWFMHRGQLADARRVAGLDRMWY